MSRLSLRDKMKKFGVEPGGEKMLPLQQAKIGVEPPPHFCQRSGMAAYRSSTNEAVRFGSNPSVPR
ncbi:MAG: hypothetical protein QME78_03640 [Thermodesulfobacteriota bacterium]|nr:hypothetical protein [Thermodesulfobacteriota bacterium]